MSARNRHREAIDYRIPLRTRQNQARLLRTCVGIKTLITISPAFKASPRDEKALNKQTRELLCALIEIGLSGVILIEFNDPKKLHGRNVPHYHVVTPMEFSYEGESVKQDGVHRLLVCALAKSLPWFASAQLHAGNLLDIRPVTDMDGLAGYLTGLDFERDGVMCRSRKKNAQKVIPKKYSPLRRTMRFFGAYENPLKNQRTKHAYFNQDYIAR